MDKKQVKLSVIGFGILLVALVGVSYAFFNYTRTGNANNLGTGRIYFNAMQGLGLNMTNVFPMTSSEAGNTNLDTVTVGIIGDTTYTDGEEYEITLVDVTNTINGKDIPINYIATYEANTGKTIGSPSSDYFTAREAKDATIYKLNSEGQVEEGKQVLVGYVDNGQTGVNGTLTIKAYIDADRIAISDTYYENAPSPSPSSSPLTSPNDEYGTTSEWVNGRTVFTTSEWNSILNTPISFKIKAESNEGIWVQTALNYFTTTQITTYLFNSSMTEEEIADCADYLDGLGMSLYLQSGETLTAACAGTGTINGYSAQYYVNNNNLSSEQINDLIGMNVINSTTGIKITDYNTAGGSDVVIPSTINNLPVITIGSSAFASKNLTSITLPNTVTKIEHYAFAYNMLTSVTIPDSVSSIGAEAFFHNPNLTQIVVPDVIYSDLSLNCLLSYSDNEKIADNGVEIVNKSGTNSCTVLVATSQ